MDRNKATELFSEYYEGTLEPGLREMLEREFHGDSDLKHEYQVFEGLMGSFGEAEPVSVPSDLTETIARKLDRYDWERNQAKPPIWRKLIPGLALAGTAAAVVFSVLIQRDSGDPAVAGPTLPLTAESPISFERTEDGANIQIRPVADASLRVYEGGTDYSSLPPSDATLTHEDTLAAGVAYERPIRVQNGNGAIVWLRIGEEHVTLLVMPAHGEIVPVGAFSGNIVEALRALANAHDVQIEARLADAVDVSVSNVSNLESSLDEICEAAGLEMSQDGQTISLR